MFLDHEFTTCTAVLKEGCLEKGALLLYSLQIRNSVESFQGKRYWNSIKIVWPEVKLSWPSTWSSRLGLAWFYWTIIFELSMHPHVKSMSWMRPHIMMKLSSGRGEKKLRIWRFFASFKTAVTIILSLHRIYASLVSSPSNDTMTTLHSLILQSILARKSKYLLLWLLLHLCQEIKETGWWLEIPDNYATNERYCFHPSRDTS